MKTTLDMHSPELEQEMRAMGQAARQAAELMARADPERKTAALRQAAAELRHARRELLAANAADVADAEQRSLSPAMLDRLRIGERAIDAMAEGLETVASLPDPIGTELARWTQPNGLDIARVRIPLGVIGIIYESRPNVTADAGGLCLRAGNAVILRGGSESLRSSRVIAACVRRGIASAGLPEDAVQLVPTRNRAAVELMLRMADLIDVIVPRGGRSLIERVQRDSRIPVIAHLEGLCHTYVDRGADPAKARAIVLNAKMRRTGVCGATETLLVDRAVAATQLPPILADLHAAGCEIRGDAETQVLDPLARAATEDDWTTEYLDAIVSVRVVDGVDAAIEHINRYGSHHTDAIVSEDDDAAADFLARVESAIVLHNASTQFADGGEFGMGAEIGISTGRLPPRGPVGAEQLTSYKYIVRGNGQVRE
jgi:glutamate-5-semialdehyde dehydrogenase